MKLKLLLEQTGQSWTLKPNRDYVIGSSQDCDIALTNFNGSVSDRHLKFSFNQNTNTWHLSDLGSSNGTFVDHQRVTDFALRHQISIGLGNSLFLVAVPEGSLHSPATTTQPVGGYTQNNYGDRTATNHLQQNSTSQLSPLQVLTWKRFVAQQVAKKLVMTERLSTWFHMITGYRNTPWIRAYSEGAKSNNFQAFDGYIIPNFKGSIDSVVTEIQNKVGSIRQYESTDCFVARLTDAHIADSATQNFFGVELFPIVRGSGEYARGDYRNFVVASYNRVRTYLLIEKYGTDLFVSWITRFEPEPTSIIIILLFILAIFFTFIALLSSNAFIIITPLIIWFEIYYAVPKIMEALKIVPKVANANLVMNLVIIPTLFLLMSGAGAVVANSYIH